MFIMLHTIHMTSYDSSDLAEDEYKCYQSAFCNYASFICFLLNVQNEYILVINVPYLFLQKNVLDPKHVGLAQFSHEGLAIKY